MSNGAATVSVVDATADRWADLADLFGKRGDPSRCWCQFVLAEKRYEDRPPAANRAAFRRQITSAAVPLGVLAYVDELAVGWCGLAPRSRYPRLARAKVPRATADEAGLWSVTCFVVRVGHRRQGVATALLDGALDLARRSGARTVEAYPVDTTVKKASSAELYWGALALYERAGFAEVARPTPSRAVARLTLS
jgi:GNAT superfamily N-acetyltransferase